MNKIFIARDTYKGTIPDWGSELRAHIEKKNAPHVRAESEAAWSLLATALEEYDLTEITFGRFGKPSFKDDPVYFSVAHSAGLVAVMVSDRPCGIDIEMEREVSAFLMCRVALPSEKDMEFFELWTLKEAIGKYKGTGVRPSETDITAYANLNQYTELIRYNGEAYRLTCVSESPADYDITRLYTRAEKQSTDPE